MPVLMVAACLASIGHALPSSYLARMENLLSACRGDLPAMRPLAEDAARRLAAGGKLWAAGNTGLVSEMSGRAGGFMMLKPLRHESAGSGDVVLFFPDDGTTTARLPADSGAVIIAFADGTGSSAARWLPTHARECGVSPTLAMAVPAWLFTGELVAALTRLDRMPVMYESIGAYGGTARIAKYKNGEIAWHADMHVPPVAAGVLGDRYVEIVSGMLRRVEKEERAKLDEAGAWAREARARGRRLTMYSMGHIFPNEISDTAIGKVFRSAVWNAGFRVPKPDDTYAPGDLIVHIGYQQPPEQLLRKATTAGARVVYVSVRPDRDFMHNPRAIWIDPGWDWPDACVPVAGYDVPILPASGVVNGAIAWEICRLTMEGK